MHSILHAGTYLASHQCDICDLEIGINNAAVYDLDERGSGNDARVVFSVVRHRVCDLSLRQEVGLERLKTLQEVANILRYQPPADIIASLEFRIELAKRALVRDSGLDLVAWLQAPDWDVRLVQGGRA